MPTLSLPLHDTKISEYPWLDETADLNKPHHPDISGGKTFVQYTEEHLKIEMQAGLKGCASLLWKWLLLKAPAGCSFEFISEDFRAYTAEFREKPYSEKQIYRAVKELTARGLMEPYKCQKVIVRHPGKVINIAPRTKVPKSRTFLSTTKPEMSKTTPEMSKTTPENVAVTALQAPTDLTNILKSADQAAAAQKVFEKEELVGPTEDTPIKDTQEVPSQKPEIGQPSKSTNEGKCSAAQKHQLEKLGIHPNEAVKVQMAKAGADNVEKAIAVFQQDLATWEGAPLENRTGYFRTVLRDVTDGNREPAPGLQHRTNPVDPVEEMLSVWRKRWHGLPHLREQFRREIAAEWPNGEIVVIDDEIGPIKGGG